MSEAVKPAKRGRPKIYTEEECRIRRNEASKRWYAKNYKPTGRPRGRPKKNQVAAE